MTGCPACGHRVPPGAKFCSECGSRLASLCDRCRAPLTTGAKFCAECGASAAPAVAPVAEGELRQLTAVFCDLVGSTELSARLGPEEFGEIVQRYQERVAEVVARYAGHVARYFGDGVLIHFGWPEAHDDDAERAVRAGLDLAAEIEELDGELDADVSVAVRIGVHTGPVVVGEMGAAAHRETMALGETMNLAARLQDVAKPGTVAISAATLRLVRGIFVTEDLGPQLLKGVAEPVTAFRAVQPSGVRSRLAAARESLTPFVSRQAELALLVDRWQRARGGSGQTVVISGEAGVGKSRIVYELRDRLQESAHSWLECRCSSYTEHSAFRPAIELIEQGLAFQPDEPPQERLAKLESGLAQIGIDEPDAVPLLAGLLSLGGESQAPAGMGPELQRRRTIELLTHWVLTLADLQPLILLIEDLHWCDPSSAQLLEQLMTQGAQHPLLLIATARPEFDPAWPRRSNVTDLALTPLTENETRAMLDVLSPGRPLPEPVVERVVRESDGIPLFTEEMGRMVLESGVLIEHEGQLELATPLEELEIPSTLQDSLMARLDRLSAAKRVAQRAAVIGREFDYALIHQTAGLDPDVVRHGLRRLVEDDLLFQQGSPPQAVYTFKHALIQDAAYRSLLKRTRKELHARIAAALERRPDSAAPEVLARHYDAAGLAGQAVIHYRRAAEQAARHSGHAEAIEHLRKAIALVGELPDDRRRPALEVDLQVSLGSSIMAIRGYADPGIEAAYERARDLCDALGDDRQVAYMLIGLAIFYFNGGHVVRGEELARRVLEVALEQGDDALRLLARVQLTVPITYQGRFAEALEHADDAAAVYDRQRHGWVAFRYGTDQGVAAHSFAALTLCILGEVDGAHARIAEAMTLAKELGHPFNVVYALFFRAAIAWCCRDFAAQAAAADQLAAISEEQEFRLFREVGRMYGSAGRALESGDEDALEQMLAASVFPATMGLRGGVPAHMALISEAQRAVGNRDAALGAAEAGLAVSRETGQHWFDVELHRLKGELLAELGGEGAEAELRRAVEVAQAQGARLFGERAAAGLARVLGGVDQHAAEPSAG